MPFSGRGGRGIKQYMVNHLVPTSYDEFKIQIYNIRFNLMCIVIRIVKPKTNYLEEY